MEMETQKLVITSPAYNNEGAIPEKYTCDGEGINPPFEIERLPENTVTLAMIAEDPDAPNGTFMHWVVWNMDAVNSIKENSKPGISGKNGAGRTGYYAPCPPDGTHRYFFYVYALDTDLNLPGNADKMLLQRAMRGHILAQGKIMGHYTRK